MDPLSQGIVGSVAAQQKNSKEKILLITIIGFLSGMAPDLDVFIEDLVMTLFWQLNFIDNLLIPLFLYLLADLYAGLSFTMF